MANDLVAAVDSQEGPVLADPDEIGLGAGANREVVIRDPTRDSIDRDGAATQAELTQPLDDLAPGTAAQAVKSQVPDPQSSLPFDLELCSRMGRNLVRRDRRRVRIKRAQGTIIPAGEMPAAERDVVGPGDEYTVCEKIKRWSSRVRLNGWRGGIVMSTTHDRPRAREQQAQAALAVAREATLELERLRQERSGGS